MAKVKKDSISIFLWIYIIFIVVCIFPMFTIFFTDFPDFSTSDSAERNTVADGFTISNYKVTMIVSKKNVVEVTEQITVDWYDSGHHGILKFTPEWYQYTGQNGKTIKRKARLTKLRAIDEEYSIDVVKKKPRIKIGSPYITLPIGPHDYTICYNYDFGKDPFKGFDEFIFHAYGDYWGTTINNASLEIHMPADFDSSQISFWADKYRRDNITSYVEYYVTDNVLYAKVSSDYDLSRALTVSIGLPEGYFAGGRNNYGYISLSLCLLISSIAIFSFFRWLKYGKDLDKVAQTVEFYPPENMDPAEIGYIYGKQTSKKLTVALMVNLASKGLLRIDESDDKKTRTFTNLYPRHQVAPVASDEQTTNNQVIQQNTVQMVNEYLQAREAALPKLSKAEQIVYDQLFVESDVNELAKDKDFYIVFNQVAKSVEADLKDRIHDRVAKKQMIKTIVLSILSLIMFFLAWSIFEDLNPAYNFLYIFSLLAIVSTAFFAAIMGRKTEYGEMITAKVAGFRNYIETAEKAQLEMLAEEDHSYFYRILPYAYALNVSKKWVKNFEQIPVPATEMGNFDYTDMVSFSNISDSISYPVSSSSGGSSCGGGCSSCGGGCSSCGGGSSW